MNQYPIWILVIVLSTVSIVSGSNICNNAPCEPKINASLGKEFTITLESNPSTGFEWWTKFDPNHVSLLNSTFLSGNEKLRMIDVPGKEIFSFNARNAGNTEVIMLLLKPWENGTVAERKIFPIDIISVAPLKQVFPSKIVNLEPIAERKTIPINITSAAAALKQAVGSENINPATINISMNNFQMSSVMGAPSQADTRKLGPKGTAM